MSDALSNYQDQIHELDHHIMNLEGQNREMTFELVCIRADNARLRELLSEACNAWEAWVTAYACERKREEIDVRIAQIRKEAGMSEGVSTK